MCIYIYIYVERDIYIHAQLQHACAYILMSGGFTSLSLKNIVPKCVDVGLGFLG